MWVTHDDDEKVLHDKSVDDERVFVRVCSKGVSDDFHELPTRVRPRSRGRWRKIGEARGEAKISVGKTVGAVQMRFR